MDMEVYSRDFCNLHQQMLLHPWWLSSVSGISNYPGPTANPHWRFGDSITSPSYLNNGSRYLPIGHANSQVQAVAACGEPELPQLSSLKPPPHSCFELIIMALEDVPEKKLTLRQIINYVVDNFPFYKRSQEGWQNSIRNKLSRDDCFKKVAKDDSDPGKGFCWTFDLDYKKVLLNSLFKLRRSKNNREKKSSKQLDHKRNMKSMRCDSPAGRPPGLEASHYLANFVSICAMRSNWASAQLMKDYASYKHYSSELSTYSNIYSHNSSLPGDPIAQANLPQALALPTQSKEPMLFSCRPSICEPNPL